MTDRSVADRLAGYAAEFSYGDLDDDTIETAKMRIADAVACGIGGARSPDQAVERLIDFAAEQPSNRPARILTTRRNAPLEYAAFVNAGLVRYLDWNDSYLSWNDSYGSPSAGHPSSNIGALLAVVQATDGDGRELLASTVLAYELYCRLLDETALHVDAVDHVTLGQVSFTLAAGKLLGLSKAELTQAVNIALGSHIGLWQARAGELTEWKGLAFGNGARNAVVAVKLAKAGLSGPTRVIDGEAGFSELLRHPVEPDVEAFGGNGGEYLINETMTKTYPVCGGIQDSMDAVFSLRNEHDLHWEDITRIWMGVSKHTVDVCATGSKWEPGNRNTADHSLPWCVARALIDGEMGPDQFAAEKIDDDRVRALVDRTEVTEHPDPFVLRVETETGTVEHILDADDAERVEPTKAEVRKKMQVAAGESLTDERIDEIFSWIETLEAGRPVSELFELLELS